MNNDLLSPSKNLNIKITEQKIKLKSKENCLQPAVNRKTGLAHNKVLLSVVNSRLHIIMTCKSIIDYFFTIVFYRIEAVGSADGFHFAEKGVAIITVYIYNNNYS